MKLPRLAALLAALLVSSLSSAPLIAAPAERVHSTGGHSPHETTSTVIGDRAHGNRVTITYGRPYSQDPRSGAMRKIWGGLVPWDQAWRLGADEATTLITQKPLLAAGKTIPAGVYTLYMIPSEKGDSQLAFSTAVGAWGVPVNEKSDLVRVPLEKETTADSVDQLTMSVDKDASGGGAIRIAWENTRFTLPFTVQP